MENLYVIRATNTGYYKIGITTRPVADRLKELQTGNHNELEVVRCYQFSKAAPVEQALHNELAQYRMKGEWFDLTTAQTVDSALDKLGQISHNRLDGFALRSSGVKSASRRFDFSLGVLSNQNLGSIGRLIMFFWSLFVPIECAVEKIPVESDFWDLPDGLFADDGEITVLD